MNNCPLVCEVHKMGVGLKKIVFSLFQTDGSAVEVHINVAGPAAAPVSSGSQLRINEARRMVQKANRTLHKLEVGRCFGLRNLVRLSFELKTCCVPSKM